MLRSGAAAEQWRGVVENGLIHARDENGATALHLASLTGSCERIIALIEFGAAVNDTDDRGATPLHYAMRGAGYDAVGGGLKSRRVNILAARGADVNARDDNGTTPLFSLVASYYPHLTALKALLKHGADPTIPNNKRETPLIFVAKQCNVNEKFVDALVKAANRHAAMMRCPPKH